MTRPVLTACTTDVVGIYGNTVINNETKDAMNVLVTDSYILYGNFKLCIVKYIFKFDRIAGILGIQSMRFCSYGKSHTEEVVLAFVI